MEDNNDITQVIEDQEPKNNPAALAVIQPEGRQSEDDRPYFQKTGQAIEWD